jgi:hypothetical protein
MSPGPSPVSPGPSPVAPEPAPAETTPQEPEAVVRFRTCRWQQPKDEANPTEFCTHREVKPYAGTASFDPNAWCAYCQYFKLRRTPKKRAPSDYSY